MKIIYKNKKRTFKPCHGFYNIPIFSFQCYTMVSSFVSSECLSIVTEKPLNIQCLENYLPVLFITSTLTRQTNRILPPIRDQEVFSNESSYCHQVDQHQQDNLKGKSPKVRNQVTNKQSISTFFLASNGTITYISLNKGILFSLGEE